MAITLSKDLYGGSQSLYCAHCQHEYTHQEKITAWWRGEDAETGQYLVSDGQTIELKTALPAGNPSDRRQGLAIDCVCESCGGITRVTVAQHKGFTLVDAVAVPKKMT